MKRVKQYKIAERAAYGFKKNGTEETKLKQLISRSKKKDVGMENDNIEDPERLLDALTTEIRDNRIFYKKGSKYEYSLQPKVREFLVKHYIPYIHREYMELINALLKKQAEKTHDEYVRRK
jgi:hypothetical protein